jgi:hypothetical protein
MDELTNNPAPAATPAPAPAAESTPAVAPMPSSSSSESVPDILKSLNWTEVIFGVLGSAALFYTIYYFRYNMNAGQAFQNQIQNKIDDLNIKISDINSVLASKQQAQSFDGFY